MPSLADLLDNAYISNSVASYHLDRDKKEKKDYNEANHGLGIEIKDGDLTYMLGQYKNSFRKNSNYGLIGYQPLKAETRLGKLALGLLGGGITGYPIGDVVPAAGLMGSYENGRFGLNLIATPGVKIGDTEIDGFLGLQGKYKLKD